MNPKKDFKETQILGNSELPAISNLRELEDQSMGKLGQKWGSGFTHELPVARDLGQPWIWETWQPAKREN